MGTDDNEIHGSHDDFAGECGGCYALPAPTAFEGRSVGELPALSRRQPDHDQLRLVEMPHRAYVRLAVSWCYTVVYLAPNVSPRTIFVKSEAPLSHNALIHKGLRSTVAAWLANAMREGRWGKTALQRESGVSRQAIAAILKEASDPRRDTVRKLATAMDVEPPEWPVSASLPGGVVQQQIGYGPPVLSLSPEEIRTIAQLAARAVQSTLEINELHTGRDGYRMVIAALDAFKEQLLAAGVAREYLADIDAAIGELGRMKQRRLDPPNSSPGEPPGSET